MKIAVIGSGISGLSAAWLLRNHHDVTLFEAAGRLGGHSNTVSVTLDGHTAPVDTGFLVHNDRTYPNLIELFRLLDVKTYDSDMSFSVRVDSEGLEWSGTSLATLFAQRGNVIKPAFWRMIRDILRFNRQSHSYLVQTDASGESLGELLARERYSREFSEWYLLPMGAAIWSTPRDDMKDFPAATFIRFSLNHGLLQITDRPRWKTIIGGSREYVGKMAAALPRVHLSTPVTRIERHDNGVILHKDQGPEHFDAVIIGTHTDEAIRMLAEPTAEEMAIIGQVRYQANKAYLHTDTRLMPSNRKAWSAWNYYSERDPAGNSPVAVSYWLNQLQALPFDTPLILTLNPPTPPSSDCTLQTMDYAHPQLDGPAIESQKKLGSIQGRNHTWYCGAWTRYGFHEDGLMSGIEVARHLGASIPWGTK